jgi:uncharacterized phage protein (TIGR01671 family)
MDKHICKAKSIVDGSLVYGYYVQVPWDDGEIAHLIIEQDAEYKGNGEFSWDCVRRVDPKTVCRYTGITEFVMTDKSVNQPLFEGDIVEINSLRRPYAGWPQSTYDGEVKVRAVIYFERGMWMLNYDNPYNNKICEPRGNEQYERSVDGALDLYYFGYKGKPDHEDWYREHNTSYNRGDIVKIGNIHDNPELLEG